MVNTHTHTPTIETEEICNTDHITMYECLLEISESIKAKMGTESHNIDDLMEHLDIVTKASKKHLVEMTINTSN